MSISGLPLRKDDFLVSVVANRHPSTERPVENRGAETDSRFTRIQVCSFNQPKRWASVGNRYPTSAKSVEMFKIGHSRDSSG